MRCGATLSPVEGVMRWNAILFGAAGAALSACAPPAAAPPPSPTPAAASRPLPSELRRDLVVFASDSFRGRETGTPDERRAASFLVDRLLGLGLEPEGDSGFVQRVPLVRAAVGAGTRFTVRGAGPPTTDRQVAGLLPLIDLGDGSPSLRTHATGDLVFAGYGLARRHGKEDVDRAPIAGRVVVVINGAPAAVDAARRAELESPAAVSARLQQISARHPAAIIVLLVGASADLYEPLRRELAHGALRLARDTGIGAPASPSDTAGPALPMILVGLPTKGSPLLPRRWPRDDQPQRLPGMRFTGAIDVQHTPVESYNVVAKIRGRDLPLQESYVAFGAHYDHLGILPPVHGDSVAHGADDDGSGCVALLAVARAMAQGPRPRRSVLFVWHTGEEKGLLGSAYFTAHPPVPMDSIVAQVNADMIGRNAPESLYVIGPGAAPRGQSRALGQVVDSVNAALAEPFTFNRIWDTPTDPDRVYYRGDPVHYAEHGVPIVFFTSGPHSDYHQVSDRAARIDYAKLAHVAQLLYGLGETLANRDPRPR